MWVDRLLWNLFCFGDQLFREGSELKCRGSFLGFMHCSGIAFYTFEYFEYIFGLLMFVRYVWLCSFIEWKKVSFKFLPRRF